MKNLKRMLALLLTLALIFGLVACTKDPESTTSGAENKDVDASGETGSSKPRSDYNNDKPLVIASDVFDGKFSSFYYQTIYDGRVVSATQLGLMNYDRNGNPIMHGINGETISYNGTDYTYYGPADLEAVYDIPNGKSVYKITLRKDLKFWDGTPITARDILFYYYVCLDPSYAGRASLNTYPIVGLQNWQTQTSSAVYDKYKAKADKILHDGSSGYVANDDYSEEMYNDYWSMIDTRWEQVVNEIVEMVNNDYADNDEAVKLGAASYDEIGANEGFRVAYGMFELGIADMNEGVFADAAGLYTWDLKTTFPTLQDFIAVTKAKYDNDPVTFFLNSYIDGTSIVDYANGEFINKYGPLDSEMSGQGITSIEGIKMLDDYNVEVTVEGYAASARYDILDIPLVPMHYYGDATKWDPDHGKYGFDRGDLEHVKSKTEEPRGAGPYIFESYKDRVVTFKSNPYYYMGQPKIPVLQMKETNPEDVANAVKSGEVDAAPMLASRERLEEVQEANSNHEISGDVITTYLTDQHGYGYMGLNANTVNVGGDPGSDASKALRKGFATIFAVYRDVSIDSFFGASASVIQYSMTNSSWAAPQATDYDYKQAYSVDANGNEIYRDGMTADEKYAAAKAAALTWFEAAGCTVQNGKVVAVPDGVKTSYDCMIGAYGGGQHGCYVLLNMAHDALAELGFDLVINNPSDPGAVIFPTLNSGNAEMWCASWNSGLDPDMYAFYHSDNMPGRGGSNWNYYSLDDPQLDQLILDARISDDMAFRKSTYKQCLNIILDWGVEVPCYQKKDAYSLSSKTINMDTVPKDVTTYWGWDAEIENLEMR